MVYRKTDYIIVRVLRHCLGLLATLKGANNSTLAKIHCETKGIDFDKSARVSNLVGIRMRLFRPFNCFVFTKSKSHSLLPLTKDIQSLARQSVNRGIRLVPPLFPSFRNDARGGKPFFLLSHFSISPFAQPRGAFTLSEVLITLGVIGILATLTIPTIIKNTQRLEDFTKLQKAISVVASAAASVRAENGNDFSNLATNSLEFANLFKPYVRVAEFCQGASDSEKCYIKNSETVYNLLGNPYGGYSPYAYSSRAKILTNDGFMYWFEIPHSSCDGWIYSANGVGQNCGGVTVDINGKKPPNRMGKDLFIIAVNKYNVTPYTNTTMTNCDPNNTSNVWNGVSCSARAIIEGGIKY